MRTIHVPASVPYDVHIGPGTLALLGGQIKNLLPKAEKAVIVSDNNVFPLHGETALGHLRSAGLDAESIVLPHGEETKTGETLLRLLDRLTGMRLTRSDVLVALGGGMIGDLTGFAAAVYMRGVGYFQVPTTLLAAVDSSVGGKTAVDLPAGKNLMGAFWQPRSVLCDTSLLSTLPEDVFTAGCAEVIKTAILFDPDLFTLLSEYGLGFDRESVITRCVEHKRDVVAEDEFDTGRRGLLNLGHTLGHAVEACSGFTLSHGQAVAIGTATVCRAAGQAGICGQELPDAVTGLLEKFGLPTETDIPMDRLTDVMLSDKKRSGSSVNVVVPEAVGRCSLRPMDAAALREFIASGVTA